VVAVRRLFAVVTVVAMALLGLIAVSGPAQGSTPVALTINVHRDGGDTWSASDAFSDAGSFVDSPGVPSFFAGSSSTFHIVRTFIGADGTFSTRADVRITATDDPNVLAVTGRWAVLSGTGAYENLSGAGASAEFFDTSTGVVQGTWQGEVLFH
jgi:hypothetical protein